MTALPAVRRIARTTAIRLHPRSTVALMLTSLVGLIGFCWPLVVRPGAGLEHGLDAPWLFAALLPLLLAVVLAEIAEGGMDAKAVALLGVLAAVCTALRPLSNGVAGFTLMFGLLIPAGRVLGPGFGFVLGAVSMFSSAVLTGGIGPWLPFQMFGAAWVGLFAGLLPRRPRGAAELAMLAAYGALAGLLYGLLLNMWFWPFTFGPDATAGTDPSLAFVPGGSILTNLHRFLLFDLATSLGFDIPRAVGNVLLVLVAGPPVLLVLRRAARRAAFDVPVEFTPSSTDEPVSDRVSR
jgi:energy-coupling factor transport system substrate-specific component